LNFVEVIYFQKAFSVKTRNFGRWSGDASSGQPCLSFTPSANLLMRRCLVRRQNERLFSALWARTWSMPGFSFNLRFLRVITNAYLVRAKLSSARNFSKSPKKPIIKRAREKIIHRVERLCPRMRPSGGTRTHSVHVHKNMHTDPAHTPPSAFCRW
jgi:hypothetical protein